VSIERYPELDREGGRVRVEVVGRQILFLCRADDGSYYGVSSICTHLGCSVKPVGSGFRCPCHGSTYAADGRNTGGPAKRPLSRYDAVRDGDVVIVDVSSSTKEGGGA
jgi:Rieske Fe-S protein